MLTGMDKDIAAAIAANETGITTKQLKTAFARYSELVSTCPTCEGTGDIRVAHATDLKWSHGQDVTVGETVPCFGCGRTGKDARYAVWVCKTSGKDCTPDEPHTGPDTQCGWFIATP